MPIGRDRFGSQLRLRVRVNETFIHSICDSDFPVVVLCRLLKLVNSKFERFKPHDVDDIFICKDSP